MNTKPYKPHIEKVGEFWFVDLHSDRVPLPVPDAKLRRLAQRWASKKNVERVMR